MDRRSFLYSTTAAGALALLPYAARAGAAPGPGDAALNKIFGEMVNRAVQRSPELATSIGFDKGSNAHLKHELSDGSPAAKARYHGENKQAIAMVEAVDPASLSPASKLDREVVLYSLNSQVLPRDKFDLDSVIRPFPIFQQGGAYFSTPDFLNTSHTIATVEDAEALLDRTAAFARVLDENTAEQRELAGRGIVAPDFSLDLTLDQMAKLRAPAPEANTIAASLAKRTAAKNIPGDWGSRAGKIIGEKVYPALDRQIALIKELRAKARSSAGLWDVPRGEEIYAAALASATTTNFTPPKSTRWASTRWPRSARSSMRCSRPRG